MELLSTLIDILGLWQTAAQKRSEKFSVDEKRELRRALGTIRFSKETIEKIKRDNETGKTFSAIWMRDSERRVSKALEVLQSYIADNHVAHRLRDVAGRIRYEKLSIRESIKSSMINGGAINVFDKIDELNAIIDDLDITLLGPELR